MSASAISQPEVEDRENEGSVAEEPKKTVEAEIQDDTTPELVTEGGPDSEGTLDLHAPSVDATDSEMSTAQQIDSSSKASLPARPTFSIPDLLSLSPGFGSRPSKRNVVLPVNRQKSNWRIGTDSNSEAFMQNGSLAWNPLSANSILKIPMSAIGIGFGERERTKHVTISVSTRSVKQPRLARYVPPARRQSNAGDDSVLGIRRSSLNDSSHRRLLSELLTETKASSTPVPVEFPESTVIESGKLPSWDERRRIRLARGTAIATVKTVIMSPTEDKSDMVSPALTRSLVAIAREGRVERVETPDAPSSAGSKSCTLPVPLSAKSLTGETTVPRTDIILCKFYHTPGLKCTASPCRFVHEINRSSLGSPTVQSLQSKYLGHPGKVTTNDDTEDSAKAVEIVEVFRMSGGGRGAGSEWAKAKFRTVPCRDYAAGYCSYGNFCSFVHEDPKAETKGSLAGRNTRDFLESGADAEAKETVTVTLSSNGTSAIVHEDVHEAEARHQATPLLKSQEPIKGDASTLGNRYSGVFDSSQGDPQRESQADPTSTWPQTNAKEDVEAETIAPSLLRASSVETIVPRNPSIMIEDRPFTISRDSTPPPTTIRPPKFRSNNIVVPDYRWTKDQGLIASPSAVSLDFSKMIPKVNKLEPAKAATSMFSAVGRHTLTEPWADQISPRTVVSPVQYADAPPLQTWQKPLPPRLGALSPNDHAVRAGASPNSTADESPFLPITAYSFSTDSSPPETPSEHRQEVVTPDSEPVDLPSIGVHHEAFRGTGNNHAGTNVWQNRQYLPHDASNPSLAQGGMMGSAPVYPWMVDAYLQQMSHEPAIEMWCNPLASGYGPTKSRWQFAKQLAKQAREGELPPQLPQLKTNYRTRPCKFFLEGDCPHGEDCSYSHDPKVIAKASRRTESALHKLRTQPCKFYNSTDGCHVGEECPFLHQYIVPTGVPLLSKPRPWRTKPCRHYAEGKCLAGDQCHFAHVGGIKIRERDGKKDNHQKMTTSEGDCSPDVGADGAGRDECSLATVTKAKSPKSKKKAFRTNDIQIIMNN